MVFIKSPKIKKLISSKYIFIAAYNNLFWKNYSINLSKKAIEFFNINILNLRKFHKWIFKYMTP